jgi:hypothetical protein
LVLLVPVLALAVALASCGGGKPTTPQVNKDGDEQTGGGELKALDSKGWGTLKGKVTLAGDKPNMSAENDRIKAEMDKHKDKDGCLAGASEDEKIQQRWKVNEQGGVANVFVWLRPPDGTYFKINPDEQLWQKEVVLDQPNCAFLPHAFLLYPGYTDPATKTFKKSGQVFRVKNSAEFAHNTKFQSNRNPAVNVTIPPKGEQTFEVKPDPTSPLAISCTMHGWMNASAWALDHPYAAVTDKDGNYEIKGAPAGVDLQVVVWHEGTEFANGPKGEKINIKAEGTTKDFQVKPKK